MGLMRLKARHEKFPATPLVWLLFLTSGLSLGLLRNAITLTLQGSDKASAAMIAFIIVGPSTILTYYFFKAIGRPFHIGLALSNPLRAALFVTTAAAAYGICELFFVGFSIIGFSLTAAVAFLLGSVVYFALSRYFKNNVPENIEGL